MTALLAPLGVRRTPSHEAPASNESPVPSTKPARPAVGVALMVALGDGLALGAGAIFVRPPVGATVIAFSMALIALAAGDPCRVQLSPSFVRRPGRIINCVAISVLATNALFDLLSARRDPSPLLDGSLIRAGSIALALILVCRILDGQVVRALRSYGYLTDPTLIIGSGGIAVELAHILTEHHEYGLSPVGFLDGFEDKGLAWPLLGNVGALDTILRAHRVRRVIVAFGATRDPDMVSIVRTCDSAAVDIHVVPRFFELGVSPEGAGYDNLWGIPVSHLRRAALRSNAWRGKRFFDIVISALALLITAPIMTVVAALVRISSPGPIFFRQCRVGQMGRPIEVLKFRSMRENGTSETQWSVEGDDRLTGVGRLIRRTSLDELPQLINVLRGDMSLVGPRPERPHFASRFAEDVCHYDARHRVPVGITGWAQIHGLRGSTSIDHRARFDNYYIENWSLAGDVAILIRTVLAILRDARKPCGSKRG